ncbi:DUF1566 domain-containing protein [Xylella fastidiosa subsp. fastidiosa]|uniref:Lcl C-terminal domain-containing protein n=2 Tax=Xylella fastidiosa TaxID=2371 RepID=Q87CE7_XYLFT|nr:DUF1566 domain-containing protein [Xylella fastidiosa]AAO28983.1 conserved hypothetical protein [Xylella fastidiosa Temecula1]ACB92625.1 hypothetical protein XfasM23_1197 [Xylella fastidiosa M23]MBE0263135.1 DUF1566 domain-containing protein [Xylella fastidiosa subsp. fastidiosa]MBE0265379.1 DUF1566 domain-containing protein [Xylella fastidiosa subsp. fastidiosa]MBE0267471.1 DUF1566 domain-containing protein [Xylella fastidiosa subsp. fastidiosa]
MSTAPLENAPTPEGVRFTKIYDEHGKHIITRDEHKGLEWLAGYVGPSSNEYGPDCVAVKECCQLKIGGYDDWRVPELKELKTIGLLEGYWYWGDSGLLLWTCTPCEQEPKERATVFKFGVHYSFVASRSDKYPVRAVRGQMRTDAIATPKAGES